MRGFATLIYFKTNKKFVIPFVHNSFTTPTAHTPPGRHVWPLGQLVALNQGSLHPKNVLPKIKVRTHRLPDPQDRVRTGQDNGVHAEGDGAVQPCVLAVAL